MLTPGEDLLQEGGRAAAPWSVAVVIPCYRVRRHILAVIAGLGPVVDRIYCVDDACPERTGELVEQACGDPRVRVLRHAENQGVGGAVLTGYRAALGDGADIIVKVDGDGQMDTGLIELFLTPILEGRADYTKGNRFHDLEHARGMPPIRLFGNACLSFVTKLSSGYWNVFDPTNGYTAIERTLAERIVTRDLAKRYFFESDMLFQLYLERAVVIDVPIPARYGDEVSNLHIRKVVGVFAARNLRNMLRRVVIQHYLRDFSLGSAELLAGLAGICFGVTFGTVRWLESVATATPATAGSVMLAAMPVLVGVQLCLSALAYDIESTPRTPRHPQIRLREALERRRSAPAGSAETGRPQRSREIES
jgi:glycosyltransferase involved in cell wall biosynthesis